MNEFKKNKDEAAVTDSCLLFETILNLKECTTEVLNSKDESQKTILDSAPSIFASKLKEKGAKYYDEPYLRFKGTKYEQETFFVKDPNENILEIKTLTANSE